MLYMRHINCVTAFSSHWQYFGKSNGAGSEYEIAWTLPPLVPFNARHFCLLWAQFFSNIIRMELEWFISMWRWEFWSGNGFVEQKPIHHMVCFTMELSLIRSNKNICTCTMLKICGIIFSASFCFYFCSICIHFPWTNKRLWKPYSFPTHLFAANAFIRCSIHSCCLCSLSLASFL